GARIPGANAAIITSSKNALASPKLNLDIQLPRRRLSFGLLVLFVGDVAVVLGWPGGWLVISGGTVVGAVSTMVCVITKCFLSRHTIQSVSRVGMADTDARIDQGHDQINQEDGGNKDHGSQHDHSQGHGPTWQGRGLDGSCADAGPGNPRLRG